MSFGKFILLFPLSILLQAKATYNVDGEEAKVFAQKASQIIGMIHQRMEQPENTS